MSNQPPKFEEIKKRFGAYPKPMMVNEQVAKTMEFKTQTRRLKTNWKVGDVLWIREPVEITHFLQTGSSSEGDYEEKIWFKYPSDGIEDFMDVPERIESTPSWMKNCYRVPNGCIKEMARTFVRVVDVRKEMLQDIGYNDITKEGYIADGFKATDYDKKQWWINLWDSTAPDGSMWKDNPKVKVVVFERIEL